MTSIRPPWRSASVQARSTRVLLALMGTVALAGTGCHRRKTVNHGVESAQLSKDGVHTYVIDEPVLLRPADASAAIDISSPAATLGALRAATARCYFVLPNTSEAFALGDEAQRRTALSRVSHKEPLTTYAVPDDLLLMHLRGATDESKVAYFHPLAQALETSEADLLKAIETGTVAVIPPASQPGFSLAETTTPAPTRSVSAEAFTQVLQSLLTYGNPTDPAFVYRAVAQALESAPPAGFDPYACAPVTTVAAELLEQSGQSDPLMIDIFKKQMAALETFYRVQRPQAGTAAESKVTCLDKLHHALMTPVYSTSRRAGTLASLGHPAPGGSAGPAAPTHENIVRVALPLVALPLFLRALGPHTLAAAQGKGAPGAASGLAGLPHKTIGERIAGLPRTALQAAQAMNPVQLCQGRGVVGTLKLATCAWVVSAAVMWAWDRFVVKTPQGGAVVDMGKVLDWSHDPARVEAVAQALARTHPLVKVDNAEAMASYMSVLIALGKVENGPKCRDVMSSAAFRYWGEAR